MTRITCIMALLALGACGVDGAPKRPADKPAQSGITISGDARIGIATE
ncbi:hypothetical protein [Paracoccus zeaxanthinifaciens]|nr:hypothetical protein [Paracoccus zeaxanthinifaciens]